MSASVSRRYLAPLICAELIGIMDRYKHDLGRYEDAVKAPAH